MSWQPDFVELCGVSAWLCDPDTTILWDGYLDKFKDHLWWFEDANAASLSDVVERGAGDNPETGRFKSRAVRLELHSMFNPEYVERHPFNCESAMDTVISSGQSFADLLFDDDESDSLKRMAAVALDMIQPSAPNREVIFAGVYFIGVFRVWYDEFRDEDGGLDDVRVAAEFVRVFDLNSLQESQP
jgi:hypothetical protein